MNLFISRRGGESALRVRRVVLIGSVLAAMAGASVALAQAPGSGSDEPAPAQAQAEMQPRRCNLRAQTSAGATAQKAAGTINARLRGFGEAIVCSDVPAAAYRA